MLMKTEKGRLELRPGQRTLGQRERALLLVADGQQSESQMAALFSGDGRRLLDSLLEQGYLERRPSSRSGNDARYTPAQPPASSLKVVPARAESPKPVPAPASPASAHGENFAGARSLASVRMFLFDLSERLFAPRDREMANRYRDALREARDPQAMLAVGRLMIADVERIAGPERADSISERLAKLLPPDVLESAA